uniref:GOLD domain-containing protein n=2 Tax=Hemiselmis andersenii TaxID=464988 RepID=A0A7S0XYL8_HEMAN|mmetsp:Transcript_31172/g.72635  ORF Transcript_31172/g.72635 Transcript_31172/m.72635 type:complete len:217 (+) Transcript_31172:2-652(+)
MRRGFGSRGLVLVQVVLLAAIVGERGAEGLGFDLVSSRVKCFSEEISGNTLVVGTYEVEASSSSQSMPIEVQVTDPMEKVLHSKEDISKGSFAFTTTIAGDYILCFHNKGLTSVQDQRHVKFTMKHGIDAKDYSKVMNSDHLSPLQTNIVKVRDQLTAIYDEMIDQKHRETQLRDLAEAMCERVVAFALFTIFVLTGTGAWQAHYLHNYFRRKKII